MVKSFGDVNVVFVSNLFIDCLSCDDRYIPGLQARRRSDDQGGVNVRQFSKCRWREVLAISGPMPVEFLDPRLQILSFFVRQVGVEDRGLISEPIPVVGYDAAVPRTVPETVRQRGPAFSSNWPDRLG